MASAWGESWGISWGDSWGEIAEQVYPYSPARTAVVIGVDRDREISQLERLASLNSKNRASSIVNQSTYIAMTQTNRKAIAAPTKRGASKVSAGRAATTKRLSR